MDRNADSDCVTSGIDHCLEVAGRIHPVRDCFLSDGLVPRNGKHGQVGTKAVGIPAGHGGLALKPAVVLAEHLGRADLRGIHQGLVDFQLFCAILPADLIDAVDYFLPDIHV